ncbi:MAG: hypothetical protein ABI601_13930 [bacterium]
MSRAGGGSRLILLTLLAVLAPIVSACGRDRGAAADGAKAPSISSTVSAAPDRAPACPRTGHWIACQVRYRIDRAGLAPHDSTSSGDLPALGPAPAVYRIGKAVLAVYLFDDSLARRSAGRTLDTTTYVAQSHPLTILSKATVIENDNLLALLFSKNEHQRERVSDALTAGPPQP